MNQDKIAVLVDSGSDINKAFAKDLDIFSLPLRVIIDNKTYTDGVDITASEIYNALDSSKVSSSLPSGEDILEQVQAIKDSGYTHIIAITISSGLSGTYNIVRLLLEKETDIKVHIIDTKNISLGSGFVAIETAKYIQSGHSFDAVVAYAQSILSHSKVYFTVGTLDYLRRGGRIGLVAGTVANVLNIKPIISCNDDGVYYTVTKIRGYSRSIQKMIDVAYEQVKDSKHYRVVLLNADTKENLEGIIEYARNRFIHASEIEIKPITPALGIHTGPEALGIGVYDYEA